MTHQKKAWKSCYMADISKQEQTHTQKEQHQQKKRRILNIT